MEPILESLTWVSKIQNNAIQNMRCLTFTATVPPEWSITQQNSSKMEETTDIYTDQGGVEEGRVHIVVFHFYAF